MSRANIRTDWRKHVASVQTKLAHSMDAHAVNATPHMHCAGDAAPTCSAGSSGGRAGTMATCSGGNCGADEQWTLLAKANEWNCMVCTALGHTHASK